MTIRANLSGPPPDEGRSTYAIPPASHNHTGLDCVHCNSVTRAPAGWNDNTPEAKSKRDRYYTNLDILGHDL